MKTTDGDDERIANDIDTALADARTMGLMGPHATAADWERYRQQLLVEPAVSLGDRLDEAERLRQVERRAHHDAYPESRSWLADWLPKDEHEAERSSPADSLQSGQRGTCYRCFNDGYAAGKANKWIVNYAAGYMTPDAIHACGQQAANDANATLNLLRDLEQRVQAVHRCGDAEQARLLLVVIKGILNGAIAEREGRV